ncbi:hypothetical protein [Pelagibius marinus]|uniref:hypothetical protein n=1 Tax=Pelagibius marinus TaxID=2762760 RepID=UPI0018727CB4|nr:hypothetical protein [Pelagibius marinus]
MKKAVKWALIAVFGSIGIIAGGVLVFMGLVWWSSAGTGIDGGKGSWALRSLFHDGPRYFRFTVNLEVAGEPVAIARVIECKPYFAHRIEQYFQKRWYMANEAMTHRLPDGSGVIVVVPKLCEDFAVREPADGWEWRAFPDLPDDFVPMILWTGDADNPQELDAYHSFDSLERPGARVHFRSAELENNPNLAPTVAAEEFGSWTNAFFGGLRSANRRPSDNNYVGQYLVVVPEADWRSFPELNVALGEVTRSGFLEPDLQGLILRHFQMQTIFVKYALEGNLDPRRKHLTDRNQISAQTTVNRIHPLEQRGDTLVERPDQSGIIIYYERFSQPDQDDGQRILIGDSLIIWPDAKNYQLFYSAETKAVYSLDRSYLAFHTIE